MSSGGGWGGFSLPGDASEFRRAALKTFYCCWAAVVAYISMCVLNGGSGFHTSGGITRGGCQRLLAGPCAECAREMAEFDSMSKKEQDTIIELEEEKEDPPEAAAADSEPSSDGDQDDQKSPRERRYGCSSSSDDK